MADEKPVSAPVVAAPEPASVSTEDRVSEAVRVWANTHLTNSPVSRDHTAWEHVQSVLHHLVGAIVKEV